MTRFPVCFCPLPLVACMALLAGCGSDLPKAAPVTPTTPDNSGTTPDNTKKFTATATLTSAAGTGSISPASQQVNENTSATFTLTPGAGQGVDSASGCGGSLTSDRLTFVTAPLVSDCTVTVAFKPVPTLSDMQPGNAVRGVATTLTFTGTTLPDRLAVQVANAQDGQCGAISRTKAGEFTVLCTFNRLGQQTLLVQDTSSDAPTLIATKTVQVSSNVSKVTWLDTGDSTRVNADGTDPNPAIPYNVPVDFTVQGVGLDEGVQFTVDQCNGVQELPGGTATARTFRCTFSATAADPWVNTGYKAVSIKTADGTQTLASFAVRNSVDSSLRDLSTLNQTGVNWCATTTSLPLTCSRASLKELYGFGQDGEVQAGQVVEFTQQGSGQEACLKDNRTGLVWEIKSTTNSRADASYWRSPVHVYTWHDTSASNGGHAGIDDYSRAQSNVLAGSGCDNTLGSTCNTQAYLQKLNAQGYCGRSNWRLPTRSELTALLNYGRPIGTPQYFGQGSSSNQFADQMTTWTWTRSTTAQPLAAWSVHFGLGLVAPLPKNTQQSIRAVSDN